MVEATQHRYIVSDSSILNGEPIIEGTRTPVRAIVETWRMGIAPEEIPQGMPHLTRLSSIFCPCLWRANLLKKLITILN